VDRRTCSASPRFAQERNAARFSGCIGKLELKQHLGPLYANNKEILRASAKNIVLPDNQRRNLKMENPDLRSIMLGMGLFVSASLALDVSVTDSRYGAIGNGTTNDRAAIQAAIDAVAAAGGGAVTLPGGKTFLSGDLTLRVT
jgi:polygalacturonase